MSRGQNVIVVGVGARTAVGMTAPASAAAVRAAISGFAAHPFMVDTAGGRMIVARASYLGLDVTGADRLAALASAAAAEAVRPLTPLPEPTLLPVFIGLPPVRPGRADLRRVSEAVCAELRALGIAPGRVESFETGHAAGTMAIRAAWTTVKSGVADLALAGGVDSYLEPETLEWLEANDQLHSAGAHNNPYGFVPGEGSGFVLLASERGLQRYGLDTALELLSVAFVREPRLIKTDAVCTGEGMTSLFRMLAGERLSYQAHHLYCDMNGEPYRADEFGFGVVRAGDLFVDPSSFTTPADCWGDVGAASGPLYLVLADAAIRKGYGCGPVVAAFTSSESGERCGFVVRGVVGEVR